MDHDLLQVGSPVCRARHRQARTVAFLESFRVNLFEGFKGAASRETVLSRLADRWMAPKRMIYLLRHGETVQEGDRRLIGQLDVPLNETGFRQARWWRQELSSVSFERCCCSDLRRSLQTADTLAGLCRGPVEVLPPLREIHLGEWQGLSTAEIQSRYPGEWERRGKDFVSFRPRGGESFSDLVDRAIPVFEQILDRLTGKTLIVAHAGVNRVILCRVLGMPLANLFRLGQGFGALNIIDCSQEGAQLSALNQLPPVTR